MPDRAISIANSIVSGTSSCPLAERRSRHGGRRLVVSSGGFERENQRADWNAAQRLATMGVSLGAYPSGVQIGKTGSGSLYPQAFCVGRVSAPRDGARLRSSYSIGGTGEAGKPARNTGKTVGGAFQEDIRRVEVRTIGRTL